MKLKERIVHIAGSASKQTESSLIEYGHKIIRKLVNEILKEGGRLLVQVGKEPIKSDNGTHIPLTFDWSVISEVRDFLTKNSLDFKDSVKKPIITVVKQDFMESIPRNRKEIWDDLVKCGAVQIEFIEAGWSSGAIRRTRMSEYGEILVLMSGGEGVEHLAQEYNRYGKPIIPIDLKLGASKEDGSGGAPRLFERALSRSEPFVNLINKSSIGELFLGIGTNEGKSSPQQVVEGVMRLIANIVPPTAFYVRLLAKDHPEYSEVESYFRNVVDPFFAKKEYSIREIGKEEPTNPWINVEIFENLHKAAIVVVDLTSLRSNCLLELGYALGRPLKVILTAKNGTKLPFDTKMYDCLFWNSKDPTSISMDNLNKYYNRNFNRPPVVRNRESL